MQKFVSKYLEPLNDLRRSISRPQTPTVGENARGDQHRHARQEANAQGSDDRKGVKPSVVSAIKMSDPAALSGALTRSL